MTGTSEVSSRTDVAVVGGGVIGTAIAWRCAQRGLAVTVIDPDPQQGAWHTAAGMLAPVTELQYTETPLLRLNLASLACFPAFVAEIAQDAGRPVGLRESGTLLAAWDGADVAGLGDLHSFMTRLGLDATLLSGRELRVLEPAVAPGLPGALLASGDHSVDPRDLHAALVTAGERLGVRSVRARATLDIVGGRARGVRLDDGTRIDAGHVVLAAGSWSAAVAGLTDDARPAVRPVKGQTLRLRLPGDPRLTHVLRAVVKGNPVYLVPRADGRIVVGASTEEAGFDVAPRAGAVYELLRDAQSLVPELGEAVLDEICTGLRPATPDNAPVIGATDVDGLLLATGHYRNGILLAPITAQAIAALVVGDPPPDAVTPFPLQRFAPVAAR